MKIYVAPILLASQIHLLVGFSYANLLILRDKGWFVFERFVGLRVVLHVVVLRVVVLRSVACCSAA
jgi:hypothetical protein